VRSLKGKAQVVALNPSIAMYLTLTSCFIAFVGQLLLQINVASAAAMKLPQTHVTRGGEFVLVLVDDEVETSRELPPARELGDVARSQLVSGLYVNDDQNKLVWPIELVADEGRVYPLADGVHLVQVGSAANTSPDALAVAFYARGKFVRSWTLSDLEDAAGPLENPCDVGRVTGWLKSDALHENTATFRVTTTSERRVEFDIAIGEISDVAEVITPDRVAFVPPQRADAGWFTYSLIAAAALLIGSVALRLFRNGVRAKVD
jgi:hypothetical protein